MGLKEEREAIGKALRPSHRIEGALLTKWVVVAEFMAPDGHRWLQRMDSDGMTQWDRKGLLHDALFDSQDGYEVEELDED